MIKQTIKQLSVGLLSTNCYLYIYQTKKCIIIDPGGNADDIIKTVVALNLSPQGIALTHGHLDHTAAAGQLIAYFKAQTTHVLDLAIHEKDNIYLGIKSKKIHQGLINMVGGPANAEAYGYDLDHIPEAAFFLQEGTQLFDSDLQILATPGHTQGSVCFYSKEQLVLFAGDTLFYQGIGRSDTQGGNHLQLLNSIKTKLLTLPDETTVYPGHGPATSIGNEKEHNPFLL
jgi:glyoxylase-like metal-dependent hydrolase (beta-lactamase superfamily II)